VVAHNRKYVLRKEDEEDLLLEETWSPWLWNVAEKSITPTYLSQNAAKFPPDPTTGMRTIVGTTFDDIIMDPKKDVLVYFYAPWCTHCATVGPIYDKLAASITTFRKESGKAWNNVIIAKMDASENECDLVGPWSDMVQSYPTIILFKAVKKSQKVKKRVPTDAREHKKLLEFLYANANNLKDLEPPDDSEEIIKVKKSANIVDREKKKAKSSEL